MKNRREFLKIFGMLTAAGAVLTTVGAVSPKSAPIGKELNHDEFMKVMTPLNARDRVTCPAVQKDIYDLDTKWLEGDYDEWRKAWAAMANGGEVQPVQTPPLQHWPSADILAPMVDNVFQNSPLFDYLSTSGNTADGTPSYTITTTDAGDVVGGSYSKTWASFKENE